MRGEIARTGTGTYKREVVKGVRDRWGPRRRKDCRSEQSMRRVRTETGSLEFLGHEQPLGEQCP